MAPPRDQLPVDPTLLEGDESAFMSFLRWLDRPFQILGGVIQGDPGRSVRHALDFWGEIPDAILPGDLIPNATTEADSIDPSELVGLTEEDSAWARVPTDIALGTLGNPLTYLPGGMLASAVGKGLKGAATVAKALPAGEKLVEGAEKVGAAVRSATGNLKLTPEQRAKFDAARGAGAVSGAVSTEAAGQVLQGLGQAERRALADVIDNLVYGPDGRPVGLIDETGTKTVGERIATLRGISDEPIDWAAVERAAKGVEDLGAKQWDELVREGAVESGEGAGRQFYLQRRFRGEKVTPEGVTEELSGTPSAIRGRSLKTDQDLLDFLQNEKGVELVRDAGERLLGRAEAQGRIVERAKAVRSFIGDDAILNQPATRKAIDDLIEEASKQDPDFARMFQTAAKGLKERDWFTNLLSKANRWFKPAAVYGLGIPRVAGISKNRLGGVWQALSAGNAGLALKNLKRVPEDIVNAFGLRVGGKELTGAINALEESIKAAGGDAQLARKLLAEKNPMMAEAVELGVTEGFVKSEDLLSQMNAMSQGGKLANKFQSFLDFPSRVFQGVEQRMRLGTFMDLRKKGVDPASAAQQVQDIFLDYSVVSEANRTVRDIVPFAQFMMKSIPQQAGAIARKPAIGIAAGQLFGSAGDEILPPWVEEQMNVGPLGEDAQGNPVYAAGLGLPLEVLNLIPSADNLGADLRRGAVASSQPLLKGLYGMLSGRDPFFDQPYGQYDKAPQIAQALGADERSEAARIYNLVSSLGIIQPFTNVEQQLSKAVDPRATGVQKAVNLLSGARLIGVDEDAALKQQLQDAIERNPGIRSMEIPYANSDDPDTQALIQAYQASRQRLRDKRAALASAD